MYGQRQTEVHLSPLNTCVDICVEITVWTSAQCCPWSWNEISGFLQCLVYKLKSSYIFWAQLHWLHDSHVSAPRKRGALTEHVFNSLETMSSGLPGDSLLYSVHWVNWTLMWSEWIAQQTCFPPTISTAAKSVFLLSFFAPFFWPGDWCKCEWIRHCGGKYSGRAFNAGVGYTDFLGYCFTGTCIICGLVRCRKLGS